MTEYSQGSEWRKWDLHIHTPSSILNNQFPRTVSGQPDWDAYLQRLVNCGVAVIGVTDYFTIDGYKQLKEFKAQGRLPNISRIFPNIEFRLSHALSSKKDSVPRRLNFHVIFSDDVSTQDIEEHFLHDVKFFYQGSPQGDDETRKLKPSNLEELGKRLIAEHGPFKDSGKSPLEIGAMTAVVNHEDITNILRSDSRFKGNYVLVYPEEGYTLIDWDGQDHLIRKGILQKADMVFSSNPKTIAWCLGQSPYDQGPDAFVKEFRSLKPCIHGSDAHSLYEIAHPCARRGLADHKCNSNPQDCDLRFCWIKSDPTFDGLKQLLYEPAERVMIQAPSPAPLKSNYTIRRLQIERAVVNKELSLAATNLELNAGLVAVAGGRGRGKTAFVDLIANCYFDRCNSDDPNSFARRVALDNAKVETHLEFKDSSTFKKTLMEPKFIEESEIVYLAQGELEHYIGRGSDLNKYINESIFESPQVKNSVKAFDFLSVDDALRTVETELLSQHDLIADLVGATAMEVASQIEKDGRQAKAELKDVDSRIQVLEKDLTEEKRQFSAQRQKALVELQTRKATLIDLKKLLENAKQFLRQELPRFAMQVGQINNLVQRLRLGNDLTLPAYPDQVRVDDLTEVVNGKVRQVIADIEMAEKELRALEAGVQEHAKALSRKQEIEMRLTKLRADWQGLLDRRKQLEEARRKRDELFVQLLETILKQRDRYTEVIALFGLEKSKVLADLDFLAEIQFDRKSLLECAAEVVDNRQVEVLGTEQAQSAFKPLLDLYDAAIVKGNVDQVKPLVDETARLAVELSGKIKRVRTITISDLYRCLYENYLSVRPTILYKQTSPERLSLGQKATVLIKIYLAQGTNPIVIDSHDEHLDNEFIMDELVEALREAKRYRQVVLASNNGNVVINSDAEQIVVAQRENGEISYLAGSIENPVIRERALQVLEGGLTAFQRRQAKYGIAGQLP